jgi:hypothetical protein
MLVEPPRSPLHLTASTATVHTCRRRCHRPRARGLSPHAVWEKLSRAAGQCHHKTSCTSRLFIREALIVDSYFPSFRGHATTPMMTARALYNSLSPTPSQRTTPPHHHWCSPFDKTHRCQPHRLVSFCRQTSPKMGPRNSDTLAGLFPIGPHRRPTEFGRARAGTTRELRSPVSAWKLRLTVAGLDQKTLWAWPTGIVPLFLFPSIYFLNQFKWNSNL